MKYNIIKCFNCKGLGLISKTKKTKCNHCDNAVLKKCCYCENKKQQGLYVECPDCLGIGEHWINDKTNKNVLVWCLSN